MKPRLLDLFCGAGGASVGYSRAGFEVVGVDIAPQPHYPFEFVQADALDMVSPWTSSSFVTSFDAIHASPPCQAYSQSAMGFRSAGKQYPDLLDATRAYLVASGRPWVIENVPDAPMRADYVLCGCMFGLRTSSGMGLRRERWFETSWHGFAPLYGHDHREPAISVVGHGTPSWVRSKLGRNPTIAEYRESMGIDWMNRNELSQAIPPIYTHFIGEQLLSGLFGRPAEWPPKVAA